MEENSIIISLKTVLYIMLFSVLTVFTPFTIAGKNLFLFYVFTIGSSLILYKYKSAFPPVSEFVWAILGYLFISTLINIDTADVLSFCYSLFFVILFIFLFKFIPKIIEVDEFIFILFVIFYSFFVVLLIGQLIVLLGFFKLDPDQQTGMIHGLFGTLYEYGPQKYRFYSLSTEPSYAAFIAILCFYCIHKLVTFQNRKIKMHVWFILIYMLIFFSSAFGFLLLVVLVISNLDSKNGSVLLIFLLVSVLVLVLADIEFAPLQRIRSIIFGIDLDNLASMKQIDNSAAMRVLPLFYYLQDLNFFQLEAFIGNGASQHESFFAIHLFPPHTITKFKGGFLPCFFYDYGILGGCFMILFIIKVIRPSNLAEYIFIFLMMLNANFNTQLFWSILLLIALINKYKHYQRVLI